MARGVDADHLNLSKEGNDQKQRQIGGLRSSSQKMEGIQQVFMPLERSSWVGPGVRDSARPRAGDVWDPLVREGRCGCRAL